MVNHGDIVNISKRYDKQRHVEIVMDKIRRPAIFLLIGDWFALGLFVFLGQLDHGMVGINPLPRLLRTSIEIGLPWTVVALLWGAYKLPSDMVFRAFFGRSLTAWLIAAPLALLLRAYLHGQATIIVIFMAITMGLGGAFLLIWRGLYFLIWRSFGHHQRE